jgi:predicted SprT family Zn-dependent metalloprotease
MYDSARAGELTAEMERALVRELLKEWHLVNYAHFREAMRAPAIELSDTARELGQWSPGTRTIRLARHLVLGQPWGVVVEVLKHEMAHQFVHEVLGATDETAHGQAFQDVCARMGIDAAASGMPHEATEEEARVAERIARLLALAESDNEHEAQAAMTAAQKLMLKHNLAARGARADYGFRHLGKPRGRVTEAERLLANLLIGHFFVDAIWVPVWRPLEGKRGTVLEIVGSHANLELASYVHAFLLDTAQRLWAKHQRDTGLRSNRDRQKYYAGVMLGFQEKLRTQAVESKKEGLVWVKDGHLEEFFRRRHPRVRNVTYRSARGSEAYAHGRAAGRNIVLHKPVSRGSSGAVRLLGK